MPWGQWDRFWVGPRGQHQPGGTPRTRQSPLTLAAFRPWGSSQDRRRAGSIASVVPRSHSNCRQAATMTEEDSPSGLWRSPGTRVGLTALAGSNPASSAHAVRGAAGHDGRRWPPLDRLDDGLRRGMGRKVAILWHASFWIAAGALYFFFAIPRWHELMGKIPHALGTAGRIGCGLLIGLAALPVVFTLLRTRKPEFGTPQLALSLRTGSVVAHVLAGVLIVGAAISEIWLSLDAAGQWLFAIYGAAAAIALLGIFSFYLSFVAELPPPPPKPLKPKEAKRRGRRRKRKDEEAEAGETEKEPTEAAGAEEPDSTAKEPDSATEEGAGDELPSAEDTVAAEGPRGGLRNRRPSGKSSSRRRRRSRGGIAVDDK